MKKLLFMGSVSIFALAALVGSPLTVSARLITYTLTYNAGLNGTINGSSTQAVFAGTNGTPVTAVPNAGYQFLDWSDNSSTTNPRTDMDVVANVSTTANFAPIAVGGISVLDALSQTSSILTINATDQLTVMITPTSALNQDVAWSSSSSTIASVDANGLITANATGNATITATASDTTNGVLSANFNVNVVVPVLSNDASLSDLEVNYATVNNFASSTFSYNVTLPYDTTSTPIVSATTDDANATDTITQATSTTGTATAMVTAQDASTTETYTINFNVAAAPAVLTSFTVSPTSSSITAGDTQQFTASGFDQYGNPTSTTITWSSSNTSTATIDPSTGVATGVASGTVMITATDGSVIGTSTLAVTPVLGSDASLSDLDVNGTTVAGFDPSTLLYSVQLPSGTTTTPIVSATTNDPNASEIITQPINATGTGSVLVTAQNGGTAETYTINFSVASAPISAGGGSSDISYGGGGGGGSYAPIFPTATSTSTSTNSTSSPQASSGEATTSGGAVLGASTSCFTQTLDVGSTGTAVTELQQALMKLGFYNGSSTAYFGVLTQAAVEAFQTKYGIDAIGTFGPKTRAQLNLVDGCESSSTSNSTSSVLEGELQALLAQLAKLEAEVKA